MNDRSAESTYLIVGGGMAAMAAVRGIRETDAHGSITLLSAEPDPPYDRPPLSKGLWKDERLDDIWREEARGVDLRLGHRAERLDLDARTVTAEGGEVFAYEKVLLVTGGRPTRLPFGSEEIVYLRTVADYRRLREAARPGRRFAVIGGGFIGSEMAAALCLNDIEVTMVFPGRHIGQGVFPEPLAEAVTESFRERGVEIQAGRVPASLERTIGRLRLVLREAHGEEEAEVLVDGVVAGIGIEPNVQLARDADLEVDDGILVDESLRTRHPDVFAAGDVAAFPNPSLGERIRVEHEDAANGTGRVAGHNMAGAEDAYRELPFFYSDLFDMGYEAVGDTDSGLETFMDWKKPLREGVVYYLADGRVRGVLLWNVWEKVDQARQLIASAGPLGPDQLKGRLTD
jgi:NADPH-dependent 2,4-dienoyl-CoA reductase/sulfur reductase-like enzyme